MRNQDTCDPFFMCGFRTLLCTSPVGLSILYFRINLHCLLRLISIYIWVWCMVLHNTDIEYSGLSYSFNGLILFTPTIYFCRSMTFAPVWDFAWCVTSFLFIFTASFIFIVLHTHPSPVPFTPASFKWKCYWTLSWRRPTPSP